MRKMTSSTNSKESIPKTNRKLSGRFIDGLGRTVMTIDGISDLLSRGIDVTGMIVEDCEETRKYNQFSDHALILYTDELQAQSSNEYDELSTSNWYTPKEFTDIDIKEWLFKRCSTNIERNRVLQELNIYDERNLYPLLYHLIFLVNYFRKNNIVWGVGRGSSVASYVLYLIGIHKVNSIKYNLEIDEFLR